MITDEILDEYGSLLNGLTFFEILPHVKEENLKAVINLHSAYIARENYRYLVKRVWEIQKAKGMRKDVFKAVFGEFE